MRIHVGAVGWGCAVLFGLSLAVAIFLTLVGLAVFSTLDEATAALERPATTWWLTAAGAGTLFLAGRSAGRRAGDLESLHAALMLPAMALAGVVAGHFQGKGLPPLGELLHPGQLVLLFCLIAGGLSVEVPRHLREHNFEREGHWKCRQCGFHATGEDEYCPRCGGS